VARFLITRKGLSKQMIGEYLGNISHPFNQVPFLLLIKYLLMVRYSFGRVVPKMALTCQSDFMKF
jgi:hypothetical protein